jgi:hypothetical protein
MKKLLFAMAVGAALAWLFDPESGSRRREMVRRKLAERGLIGPAPEPYTAPTAVADYPAPLAATGR